MDELEDGVRYVYWHYPEIDNANGYITYSVGCLSDIGELSIEAGEFDEEEIKNFIQSGAVLIDPPISMAKLYGDPNR